MGKAKRCRSVVVGASVAAALATASACPGASDAATAPGDAAAAAAAPSTSSVAPCTDSFVGPDNAKWTEAANWSAGRVPTREDVACIPAGVTVSLWFEREAPAGVYVRAIHGGSILTNTPIHLNGWASEGGTTLEALKLNGTSISVGAGNELTLSRELWVDADSALNGRGTVTLEPSAVAELGEQGCGTVYLNAAQLVNRGAIHVGRRYTGPATIGLSNGARIVNDGTLGVDTEDNTAEDCEPHYAPTATAFFRNEPGPGEPGEGIVNNGTLRTEDGTNPAVLAVPVTNDGTAVAREGALTLSDGGVPTECSTGTWRSDGAQLTLAAGTFNVAPGASLTEAEVAPGAVVAGCPTQPATGANGANGGLSVAGSTANADGAAAGEPGGSPAPAPRGVSCVVPRVHAGATLARVRALLAASHCRVGRVRHEQTRQARAGRVVALNHRAGEHLPDDAAITVTVAATQPTPHKP